MAELETQENKCTGHTEAQEFFLNSRTTKEAMHRSHSHHHYNYFQTFGMSC